MLCLSMAGCSNSDKAFKVGDAEFSNEDVQKVEAILVNTADYTNEDYLADFIKSKDDKEAQEELKNQVLSYMINNEVVYQQAKKDNIKVTDDEVNEKYNEIETMLDLNTIYKNKLADLGVDKIYLKETIEKDLVIQKYKEKFEKDIIVTDKEIKDYYDNNKEDFKVESVQASHILISTLDYDNNTVDRYEKEKLKEKAYKILERIRSGEDFAKLAKENSDDKSSGKKGGELDYFTREDKSAEFTKEVFKLNQGEVSDVIETHSGYEIVKATNKKTEQKSLEDSREEIINRILAYKYLAHIQTLRENTKIEIF